MKTEPPFSIYLAQSRYLESDAQKLRPVIAVSKHYGTYKILLVIPISSQLMPTDIDVELDDWQTEGLIKPSVARLHRLTAMMQADLTEKIGTLSPNDKNRIQQALKRLLELE